MIKSEIWEAKRFYKHIVRTPLPFTDQVRKKIRDNGWSGTCVDIDGKWVPREEVDRGYEPEMSIREQIQWLDEGFKGMRGLSGKFLRRLLARLQEGS